MSQKIESLRASLGLSMDVKGRLWQNDEPFEHPRITQWIRQHLEFEEGEHRCKEGSRWVPIAVERYPLRVRQLHLFADHPELAYLDLDDGRTRVSLCPSHFRGTPSDEVLALVPSVTGQSILRAQFLNCALIELSNHLRDLETNTPRWCPEGQTGLGRPLPHFWEALA